MHARGPSLSLSLCLSLPLWRGRAAFELFEAAVSTETHPPEPDAALLRVAALVAASAPLYREALAAGRVDYCMGLCGLARTLMVCVCVGRFRGRDLEI